MPHSTICVKEDGIYRCNERSNSSEVTSNFTVRLTASVDCDKSAESGGPGFFAIIKRFPDEVESYMHAEIMHLRLFHARPASTVMSSAAIAKPVLMEVSRKIKVEMKQLSSDAHDSILRDAYTVEALKHFDWERVMLELEKKLPILLTLLKQIVPRPTEQEPLLCLVASQLLKSRHQWLGLVQRAVSIMLYGNGSSKQVYMNLQPLQVCMSYKHTLRIVDKISEHHDVEVQFWRDEMKRIPKPATIWQRLYSVKSTTEKATMYQLRNVINRTSVPSDPSKNMNAAEDFLLLLVCIHMLWLQQKFFSLSILSSVLDLASAIAVNFVRLPQTTSSQVPATCEDGVHLYAVELLTLSLLWHGFHDAVKEGDGERIVRYWKFLLLIFKSSNHPNYAKEAIHLLLQYYYFFSERQKAQLGVVASILRVGVVLTYLLTYTWST